MFAEIVACCRRLTAGPPQAVGAGNAHNSFEDSFVELVTVVGRDGPPEDAVLVPLDVPDGQLEWLAAGNAATTDRLETALARFPGPRPVPRHLRRGRRRGPAGGRRDGAVPLAVVEIDGAPEGRIALAEPLPAGAHDPEYLDHPNGAVGLSDVLLCVAEADLAGVEARYAAYLDRAARAEDLARCSTCPGGG
jgi:Glyoxalase-like domain